MQTGRLQAAEGTAVSASCCRQQTAPCSDHNTVSQAKARNAGQWNLPAVIVMRPFVAQVDHKADECDQGLQDDIVQDAFLALPEKVDAHVPLPAGVEWSGGRLLSRGETA